MAALAWGVCASSERAAAQAPPPAAKAPSPWKVVRPAEPRNGKVEVPKMLRSGEVTDAKLLEDYGTYMISQLTWPETESDFFKFRNYIKSVLKIGKDPARERLIKQVILPFCTRVAKGPEYSPQARVNAVLVIGDLNQVEPVPNGPPQVSLADARPVLLELVDPQKPVDDLHDALRTVAMIGLMNHLERGGIADDRQKKQALDYMQAILKAEQPPAGRTEAVHKWIKRLANEVASGLNGGRVATGR
ncbi:MAG: hypothetical protein JNG90_05255 [Planctomycetaceae bacterium]|nr:hypothetical protein [Planctomycetaceae bacterium]